jgi:hypothetical protein
MDISLSIDTDKPLSPVDRAMLRALLADEAPQPAHPGAHTPRPSIQDQIAAASPNGARASAKLPVTRQPGVTMTESTREDNVSAD